MVPPTSDLEPPAFPLPDICNDKYVVKYENILIMSFEISESALHSIVAFIGCNIE